MGVPAYQSITQGWCCMYSDPLCVRPSPTRMRHSLEHPTMATELQRATMLYRCVVPDLSSAYLTYLLRTLGAAQNIFLFASNIILLAFGAMVDDNVLFNIAAFISGLYVLEAGADVFIDNTAELAARLNVSPTFIALLTSGAEWEESSLAIGNIVGSSISNILGAFSLGLIFSPSDITFDRSSKVYTTILLILTTFYAAILSTFGSFGRVGGGILIVTFGVYVISIAYAIYKGIVAAPEDDSDSDTDSSSDDGESNGRQSVSRSPSASTRLRTLRASDDTFYDNLATRQSLDVVDVENGTEANPRRQRTARSTQYHLSKLVFGLLALCLSGYILSHSMSAIATRFELNSTVIGTTILSIATTLPEKVIAILSGRKRQGEIIVANTVGSNLFLLTLCTGVLYLAGDISTLNGSLSTFELVSLWISSTLLCVVVWIGGRRLVGWVLLGLYLAFLVGEFFVIRS
ncbi:Sodium calcium exchanger membrane region protein [Rutstroemia sp. NJR-2017a BVV2]|nr:Sodium calcium exchanger membrane region protein [Rutstroemia sp. NJR-2017a BVV2]